MSKQALQAAFDSLPDGIAAFLATPLPAVADIAAPADVDAAIIAQGQLAANLNTILQAFAGLELIRVFMHIAQHNEVLQVLGGVAVQYLWAERNFIILSPQETLSYASGENTVAIRITAGKDQVKNVSCTYLWNGTSGGVLAMPVADDDPEVYIDDMTYVAGQYEFSFIVDFNGDHLVKTVSITVQ